ncbi:MAG: hypothetical protein H7Z41_06865, partial [Cytophagales bacterium]|nr:hypothetical protein [Armatimonadota bacterium]
LLCASQGIEPVHVCRAIAAAYAYDAPGDATAPEIQERLRSEGFRQAFSRFSRLPPDSPIARRAEREYATIGAARPS